MNSSDHHDYRQLMEHKDLRRREIATEQQRIDRIDRLVAQDANQDRPWQSGFMLRLIVNLAGYGAVAWWLQGLWKIPIPWPW